MGKTSKSQSLLADQDQRRQRIRRKLNFQKSQRSQRSQGRENSTLLGATINKSVVPARKFQFLLELDRDQAQDLLEKSIRTIPSAIIKEQIKENLAPAGTVSPVALPKKIGWGFIPFSLPNTVHNALEL